MTWPLARAKKQGQGRQRPPFSRAHDAHMIETYFSEMCIRARHRPRRSREISCLVKDEAGRADGHWMRNWLSRIFAATGDPGTEARLTIRKAQARGLQLLIENLSTSQRDQYEKHGFFDVIGGQTGKRYRIWHGSQMNVELFDSNGRCLCKLCFEPIGHLGVGDVMLAQKIALELFESEARMVASKAPPAFTRLGQFL